MRYTGIKDKKNVVLAWLYQLNPGYSSSTFLTAPLPVKLLIRLCLWENDALSSPEYPIILGHPWRQQAIVLKENGGLFSKPRAKENSAVLCFVWVPIRDFQLENLEQAFSGHFGCLLWRFQEVTRSTCAILDQFSLCYWQKWTPLGSFWQQQHNFIYTRSIRAC